MGVNTTLALEVKVFGALPDISMIATIGRHVTVCQYEAVPPVPIKHKSRHITRPIHPPLIMAL